MGLSQSGSTTHMRTTTSLADDSRHASLVGLDAAAIAAHQGARGGFQTRVGERANVEPQTVDIWVDRGYQPAQTVATADVPLRIVFHRRDADHCTERVMFSSPHIERRLAANGTTAVDLPAQPPGLVRFTCGMGRYRGEIALVRRRTKLVPSGRLLGPLVLVGAIVVTLLAATGIVQVELAAGSGVLIAAATGVALFASRLRTHPYRQP
jgi:hypothetical protein